MKELAKRYIEGRIQTTRTNHDDNIAATLSNSSGKSQVEHAQLWAQAGLPAMTASFLNQATELSVGQKGKILAEAYTALTETYQSRYKYADHPALKDFYQKEAQQSKRIAQGLTRAAKKAQKS